MASIFGHALAAGSMGSLIPPKEQRLKFYLLGMFCAIFPDADVIAFSFGIPYESLWGHRGITHSISFSLLFGLLVTRICYPKTALLSKTGILYSLYFALCTLSHALLDAMTTGGLGVAFFAPFENTRYFFPWRPILVSPLGAANFFSDWGLQVIKAELFYIFFPCTLTLIGAWGFKKYRKRKAK